MKAVINGHVDPRFTAVREIFSRNFQKGREIGAACAVYWRGQKVVDLWGGLASRKTQAPWTADTKVLVFSTTKGLAGMCIALLHSRGLLDFDSPVADYWPEFAAAGKAKVTVRQLLSHQAGLCCMDEKILPADLDDFAELDRKIAAQAPLWEPGARHAYHAVSIGWYENALVRRVDPAGRSLGRFFREEIAGPLGLDFHIGLPESVSDDYIAPMHFPANFIQGLLLQNKASRGFFRSMMRPGSLTNRAFFNPSVDPSSRAFVRGEHPAFGGVGTAAAIARAYDCFARGGAELGIKPETMRELTQTVPLPSEGDFDALLGIRVRFSLGYLKPFDLIQFGSGPASFGTPGAGGSFGFADPDRQVGFAYVTNRMGMCLCDDPREKPLRDAVYDVLKHLDPIGQQA